ncbi:MAG: tRNA lysidine(34) synthetase TilS [Treponema sp.]|nr:tRNA lysidine(34) synthetase TilS [Treponema sp.]
MNPFEASVKTALGISPGAAAFLAAVSGGADSNAMLAALTALRGEMGFTLQALHVEHGMRSVSESLRDASAVRELCEELEVPYKQVSIPRGRIAQKAAEWGIGPEAAARFYRHRALRQEAKRINADRILLAHTKDDVLETILMRIIRGSGPAGLAGMPMERGLILRPLLEQTRADVLAYLDFRGISYQTDSTNADLRYLRNRIRHKLVPCLDEFFPSWRQSLLDLAETQAKTASFLSNEAERRIPWTIGEGRAETAEAFMANPIVIKEEAVFHAVDMLCKSEIIPKTLRRQTLRNLLKDMEKGTAVSGDLGPVRLEKQDKKVLVTKAKSGAFEYSFSLLINEPGIYKIKGLTLNVEAVSGDGICSASISLKGMIGNREQGAGSREQRLEGYCFSASFPFVLRPWKKKDFIIKTGQKRHLSDTLERESRTGYKGFITAEDGSGIAAIIGLGRRTFQRNEGEILLKRTNTGDTIKRL